jgi:hypothetical protein
MLKPQTFMKFCVLLCIGMTWPGCIATFYQPMSSLQRPVLVNISAQNVEKARILMRCHASDATLDVQSARVVCKNLRKLFSNQGAEVEFEVPREGRLRPPEPGEPPFDLIVDLYSRKTKLQETGTVLFIVSALTLSLFPVWQEYDFEQAVTVRDGQGFLMAQDTFKARIVDYGGLGIFLVNAGADLFRASDEQVIFGGKAPSALTGNGSPASVRFSRDFYGQMSQIVYDGHIRSRLLKETLPNQASLGTASGTTETGN